MYEFVKTIDEAIKEFENYKTKETENSKKIIFSAIVSRLLNIREAYFKDITEIIDNKRKREE